MKFFKILFFTLLTLQITAQTRLSKAQVDSLPNTIENQFTKIYRLSNNWQEYKMVKRTKFLQFQKEIIDSVHILKTNISTKQGKITNQQKTITDLESKITLLNNDLSTSIDKENGISLFGMLLNKTTYNSIVWGIIIVLLTGLFFFIYRFNNSNVVTKETKELLTDVEQEFEQYKKKSLDKEQKLRRQLQDEINKQRGV